MPTLLHITLSPRGHHSISRKFGAVAVHEWKEHNPGGRVSAGEFLAPYLTELAAAVPV